jgi:hypothetical protein
MADIDDLKTTQEQVLTAIKIGATSPLSYPFIMTKP